jgi:fucose permease
VLLGLPDGILGVAWPSISSHHGVPIESLGLIFAAMTASGIIASFTSSFVQSRLGPGTLVTISCTALCLSSLGFAFSPNLWLVLVAAALTGLGGAGVDVGLNTVAATRLNMRVINWMHACYGIGASLGPAMMTVVLLAGWLWQSAYMLVALGFVSLIVALVLTRDRWNFDSPIDGAVEAAPKVSPLRTLRLPRMWLCIGMFAVSTGMELTAGQWTFTVLTEDRGMATGLAGSAVTLFYAGLTAGRIGIGVLGSRLRVESLLRGCVLAAIAGALLFLIESNPVISVLGLALTGLAFGPVFPSMISATVSRVGEAHAGNAVSLQITAAAIGIAAFPGMGGLLARVAGLHMIGILLVAGSVALLALHVVLMRTKFRQ